MTKHYRLTIMEVSDIYVEVDDDFLEEAENPVEAMFRVLARGMQINREDQSREIEEIYDMYEVDPSGKRIGKK